MMFTSQAAANGTEVNLIYLTFWDKATIVAGAIGFLLLVAICMVCFLCPDCLGYGVCCGADDEYEKKKKDKQKMKTGSQKSTSSKGSYGSTDSDYFYAAPPPPDVKDSGPIKWKHLDIIKEGDNHNTSDWSSDTGMGLEVIQLEKARKKSLIIYDGLQQNGDIKDNSEGPMESGTILFTLSYLVSEEKLSISVKEVTDVKLKDGKTLVSPYIRVRLYRAPKQFFTFRENAEKDNLIVNLEKEFKTKMHRPCGTLAYNETFTLGVDLESLKTFTLRLLLCDMDKLSRHMILGETTLRLKKTQIWTVREISFSEHFHPAVEENLGSISIGLSYLPTSEKMYLSVESIKGLKVMDKVTGSTDACVKAYLMFDGRQLKRVKTTVRAADLNPVFNESFSFDVPLTEVEKVYFSLVVCHYDAETKSSKIIGRVYIGKNFDSGARDHWTEMLNNSRKKIVASYKITN